MLKQTKQPIFAMAIQELLILMARLRDSETGCPWDLKQNFDTLLPHTLGEIYELLTAIESADPEHIKEELGDVLFQIVFYAQLASETGWFDFSDICKTVLEKMIRRHPHIFPDGTLASRRCAGEVAMPDWQKLKDQEKKYYSHKNATHSILSNVPDSASPLMQAYDIQQKVTAIGFDWPNVSECLEKIFEEIAEIKQEIEINNKMAVQAPDFHNSVDQKHEPQNNDPRNGKCQDYVASTQAQNLATEIGDLFFTLSNVARKMGLHPEHCLMLSNQKFRKRFEWMEQKAILPLDKLSSQDLEVLWSKAKHQLT